MRKKKLKNFWRINEHLKNNKYWLLRVENNLQKLKKYKYNFKNQIRYSNKVKRILNSLKSFNKNQQNKNQCEMSVRGVKKTSQPLEFSQNKLNLVLLIHLLVIYNFNFRKVGMENKKY